MWTMWLTVCEVTDHSDDPASAAARVGDGWNGVVAKSKPSSSAPVSYRGRMLNVSRATVREAIARLAESGYVTVRRGRAGGTFVAAGWGPDAEEMIRRTLNPEWQELELLLDFRQLVEQQIARTAAIMLAPVAIPSSTKITVLPLGSATGRPPR